MTPSLRLFSDAFGRIDSAAIPRFQDGDPPSLLFEAVSDAVGPLEVCDDTTELTVCVGQLHHTHFPTYDHNDLPADQRMRAVARKAAAYVVDVLADHIEFSVFYRGSNCVGSSAEHRQRREVSRQWISYPLSAWWFRKRRVERYVWSGPIDLPGNSS